MIRRESLGNYQCVNRYRFRSCDSDPVNSIPFKRVLDIFTSDFIIYDDVFRAVGIHYDLNYPDTRKGPDITFSLSDFSSIFGNLKYRDLVPPLIRDNQLTARLFGLTEIPGEQYETFATLYSKLKILERDEKGELRKNHGS